MLTSKRLQPNVFKCNLRPNCELWLWNWAHYKNVGIMAVSTTQKIVRSSKSKCHFCILSDHLNLNIYWDGYQHDFHPDVCRVRIHCFMTTLPFENFNTWIKCKQWLLMCEFGMLGEILCSYSWQFLSVWYNFGESGREVWKGYARLVYLYKNMCFVNKTT